MHSGSPWSSDSTSVAAVRIQLCTVKMNAKLSPSMSLGQCEREAWGRWGGGGGGVMTTAEQHIKCLIQLNSFVHNDID